MYSQLDLEEIVANSFHSKQFESVSFSMVRYIADYGMNPDDDPDQISIEVMNHCFTEFSIFLKAVTGSTVDANTIQDLVYITELTLKLMIAFKQLIIFIIIEAQKIQKKLKEGLIDGK